MPPIPRRHDDRGRPAMAIAHERHVPSLVRRHEGKHRQPGKARRHRVFARKRHRMPPFALPNMRPRAAVTHPPSAAPRIPNVYLRNRPNYAHSRTPFVLRNTSARYRPTDRHRMEHVAIRRRAVPHRPRRRARAPTPRSRDQRQRQRPDHDRKIACAHLNEFPDSLHAVAQIPSRGRALLGRAPPRVNCVLFRACMRNAADAA